MSLPVGKREFDLFLSHAHKDREFVSALDRWLTESADLSVWYDAREMAGGALLATELQAAIGKCRGMILVASGDSLARGWVRAEYNAGVDERANSDAFRVVALRIGDADVNELLKGTSWIDLPVPKLDTSAAKAILHALYPGEKRPNPRGARDVFVSCSWRSDDSASARAACKALVDQGFRLIGDAKDQLGYGDGDRVERIIASCGAFVTILPFRGEAEAKSEEGPYKYFLQELGEARRIGLPCLVLADPRVRPVAGKGDDWVLMETAATRCPPEVTAACEALWEQWAPAPRPQYVFYAADLSESPQSIRHLIERITGMETVVGSDVRGDHLQGGIVDSIRGAFLVLADITEDNLNTCIEAGMGLACRANVQIFARGPSRRPPFMLRSLQMPTYSDEIERIGVLHRILRPFRRRVINAEL